MQCTQCPKRYEANEQAMHRAKCNGRKKENPANGHKVVTVKDESACPTLYKSVPFKTFQHGMSLATDHEGSNRTTRMHVIELTIRNPEPRGVTCLDIVRSAGTKASTGEVPRDGNVANDARSNQADARTKLRPGRTAVKHGKPGLVTTSARPALATVGLTLTRSTQIRENTVVDPPLIWPRGWTSCRPCRLQTQSINLTTDNLAPYLPCGPTTTTRSLYPTCVNGCVKCTAATGRRGAHWAQRRHHHCSFRTG